MASILPDFEYDIFISYRHNDNRSGWVREFVHHLREELAATLKDPVSIYFDENTHDGLLETDLVEDSLREKVKCLIFIPIISQTYCDPKSFAWENEFKVFKKLAHEDTIGLKVKLPNGNTTSRVLPVKIHDLDAEDKTLLEEELGGVLRSIDFIFKSSGVNRPLRAHEEHSQDNLNKTFYRDQVNKVANCIKEIMGSLKGGTKPASASLPGYPRQTVRHPARKKLALLGGIVLSLMVASFLTYHFFQPDPEPLDKSIAVLAFDDLSQNHDQEYFSDGISEEIINALVKIEGLKVPSRTSSFWFKGKDMDLSEIGEKLNVALILEGSVRKSGDNLRITAQLVDAKNGFHLWSQTYDHNLKDVFKAQDEVTKGIIKQLQMRLSVRGTVAERKLPTQNLEAYDLYLKGHKYFLMKGKHVIKARELLIEAVRLDPNFALAHAALAEAYAVYDLGLGNIPEALASAHRALAIDSSLSSAYAVIAWSDSTNRFPTLSRATRNTDLIHSNFERAIQLDPQNSTAHLWFGITLVHFGLYTQAFDHLYAALEIDPMVAVNYGALGFFEYQHGEDSIGYIHLMEGIKLGWAAGNQRLALYYLDHNEWEKAENAFREHARLNEMSIQLDYHQLVMAIQEKDIQTIERILAPVTDNIGFIPGIKIRILSVVGQYDKIGAYLNDYGVTEAMRPIRKELRKQPDLRRFIKENGFVDYWKKYGWPDVCYPVGENDFECN